MDETLVAPVRMHTRGYTGAKTQNQREAAFYLDEEARAIKTGVRETMVSLNNIPAISAFQFSQFVRAELFVYIDMLLTSNFHMKKENQAEVSESELNDILEICESYCKLYHNWLLALPETFKAVSVSASVVQ